MLAGQLAAARDILRALARERLAAGDGELAARAVLAMGGGIGGFEVDVLDVDRRRCSPLRGSCFRGRQRGEGGHPGSARRRHREHRPGQRAGYGA